MVLISKISMRLLQIVELYEFNGLKTLLNEIFYRKRCAIAVEKYMGDLEPFKGKTPDDVRVVSVNSKTDKNIFLKYTVKHRKLKCESYLESGYNAFVLKRADHVLGDIWYATKTDSSREFIHPDMEWLNLVARPKDVYMFDMFLNPNERGNGMAAYLQHNALLLLKQGGFEKAYGFFMTDNIPALWVHRLLKWEEIKKVHTKRFIYRRVIGEENLSKSATTASKERV